jgi:toxin ParE1/3/4
VNVRYVLSDLAQEDLADIWEFFAQQSEARADRQIHQILADVQSIAEFPMMGRASDFASELRVWKSGQHLIFYIPQDNRIYVRRVLHGHRDIEAMFADQD